MALQQAGHRTFAAMSQADDTDVDAMAARLEAVFAAATPQQAADGATWYARRNEELRDIAEWSSVPLETLAHAASALSVQTRWDRNRRALEHHIRAFVAGVDAPRTETLYGASDTKARRILETGDTAHIGNGDKTRAFARNLLLLETLPGGKPAVTIDTVMYQCLTGRVHQSGITGGRYQRCASVVRTLADKYGMPAHEFQAITWVVFRGTGE
jgi:hypothetical protein